ncbi:MAG: acylphosphatase [Deltaproteobacteria bacterium]|nr:acylphosphatase [Deltaproteobacteria bacterium]
MKTIHAKICGRVQGVCFRYYTRKTALELGIRGWVRNLPNRCVELLASGTPDALRTFEKWLSHGPPMASVATVEVREVNEVASQSTFEIIDTGDTPL